MMKIGYDAKRIVRNGTGLGNYGRTLVNDIAQQDRQLNLRLYAPDKGRDELRGQIVARENVTFCYPHDTTLPFAKAWWRTKGMVKDLKQDQIQIYHGLSGELPFGISKTNIRSVVTIHDLIFLRHPEFYHWLDTKIYTWKFLQTIKEADHIIAISECTKRDIMEFGNVDEKQISVIYQSCSLRFISQGDGSFVISRDVSKEPSPCEIRQRYILSVGSIEARKNILLAVKALPYLPDDVNLVIVGRHTKYTDVVIDYVQKHGLEQRVKILHGVKDEELPNLYAGAEAFVYPSLYEGFGIPIIEAISTGLPVVACTGSCLEEAGGPDNLYVAPDDAEGMAAAIRQTLRGAEGREERILRSQAYIRRFEGKNVAQQVVDLYHQLLF
ncbi:MAG: glycosyltransferase family 4 protein [Prevotella sp.]|nr:glycosyltransferase family 4 protein [Prevotella sp.]